MMAAKAAAGVRAARVARTTVLVARVVGLMVNVLEAYMIEERGVGSSLPNLL